MEKKGYSKPLIDRFDFISEEQIEILKQNNIKTLEQLINNTRKDLRKFGFENYEINKIDLELQLLGMSLKDAL